MFLTVEDISVACLCVCHYTTLLYVLQLGEMSRQSGPPEGGMWVYGLDWAGPG